MPFAVVRGSAAAAVTPDHARLQLVLAHTAADPATALDRVAEQSQRLDALLTQHGIAAVDRTTDGITVGERRQWRNNEEVMVGFEASTRTTVTVRTIAAVGALVRDSVADAGAAVAGLDWRIDDDNPARRDVLGAAARDARARAGAYAEALGLRLGEVDLVSEAPIVPDQPRPMMAMADAARVGGAPELAVDGGVVELTATVHVRFALLP